MWLKQQQSHGQTNDSDEDDTEQFGIREGGSDDGEPAAADDEDEEEVLPLFGDDESDFGSSSSEVKVLLGSLLCKPSCDVCHEEMQYIYLHVHIFPYTFCIYTTIPQWSYVNAHMHA